MTSPVDPNDVMMTGENSFIRLSSDGGKTQSDRISHWRVLWCPAGAGHALFMQSTLTGGAVRIYADHVGVARWLQGEIEKFLFPAFADQALPVTQAEFSRAGGADAGAAERVRARDVELVLSWSDFLPAFVLNMPPGSNNRPIGVFSTFFPRARRSGGAERPSRARPPLARETGRARVLERLPGMVGDLGEAPGLTQIKKARIRNGFSRNALPALCNPFVDLNLEYRIILPNICVPNHVQKHSKRQNNHKKQMS